MPLFAAAAPVARRFVVHVTPEMIRHSRILDALYFIGFFYSVAVLVVILRSGMSVRLRDIAARAKWPFVISMAYFALLSVATTIFEFPLSFYGGFVLPHQFHLTTQSLGGWLGDFGKGFAVDVLIGAFVAALALLAIRRVRRWWIVLWLGSIPLIILGVIITPLVIDPLFNKFEPLKDVRLRNDLLAEAARAGIEGSRVYQVDKSKQTTTMNAYVTGIGPSKRIVIWDTLLAKMDHDEILAVMGHEMGHYVLHHIWIGVGFGVAVSFFGFLIAQWIYDRGLRWWGFTDRADPAALPWLLLVAAVITFLLSPLTNGFSRHIEHEADRFGLDLTHLNEATASAEVKFAEDSKQDPSPPRFIEWWRYTHPSAQERIDFALRYHPWRKS
ncbi:MAG TPA: M48 family metallopeptidase [Thermoanaerobaculia bacterium]|nr:M48 family metallopeptidase [Thermoanaerobaculia bacterium]